MSWLWSPTALGQILLGQTAGGEPPATTGQAKVWNGSAWTAYPVKIWNGSAWETKSLKHYNGSSFVATNY